MTEQLKTVLKGYFQTHDIPTENNFADLIDSLQAITPNEDGSIAIGYDAVVTGKQALQVGKGTNTTDHSIKVGGGLVGVGILILGNEPQDTEIIQNGSLWVDSFGIINFKSNNKIVRFK